MRTTKTISWMLAVTMLMSLFGCGKQKVQAEPDVFSNIRSNTSEYLNVVANTDKIKDNEEFAWKLIQIYEDNSFETIKFSERTEKTDRITMNVYHWRDDVKNGKAFLHIVYIPDYSDTEEKKGELVVEEVKDENKERKVLYGFN